MKLAKHSALACTALAIGCTSSASVSPPAVLSKKVEQTPVVHVPPPPPTSPAPEVDGPRIRVSLKEILVDDTSVGWNPALIVDRLQKIDQLVEPLRALRDSDDKAMGAGECVFEFAPDVPFLAAASVLGTSSIAGCPVAWISSGSGWIKLRTPLPLPSAPPENKTPNRRQMAVHLGATLLDLKVFAVVPEPADPKREQLEQQQNRLAAREPKGLAEIADGIVAGCENSPRPCPAGLWLTADSGVLWSEMASVLSGIVRAREKSEPQEILVSFQSHGTRPIGALSNRAQPEEIQRLVRANFGSFRRCYGEGLGRNPNLQGRVAVRFTIGKDGRVTEASAEPSSPPEMPDKQVVSCVVQAMKRLVFPAPPNGIVTVVYPIMFSPGD